MIYRLCNSICPTRQFSPELDLVKLNQLEGKVSAKLQERDRQARELKFETWPELAPPGWHPRSNPMIEDQQSSDNFDEEDEFGVLETGPKRPRGIVPEEGLESALRNAEASDNPVLESMFGRTIVEKLRLKTDLLKNRAARKELASRKSASGSRLRNGAMSQQIGGMTLAQPSDGPSARALQEVTRRTGKLIQHKTLIKESILPGRVQVRL